MCTLSVRETNNNIAAAKYPVRIIYDYDHYGVLYIWNAPRTTEAHLDEDGRVTMKISNFYHPSLVVGSTIFVLNEAIIKNGGVPRKFRYSSTDEQYQEDRNSFKSYQLPPMRYPEVDVVISKPAN